MKRSLVRFSVWSACLVGRGLTAVSAAFRRREPTPTLHKALLIKLWAIGEVVMASPVLEALKRHAPGCEVHMLVGRKSLPVVENNPFCDRVIPVDEDIFLTASPFRMLKLAAHLRRENFDTAVVLHHLFVFPVFAWLCGIPVRAGLDRKGEGFALNIRTVRPSEKTHRVKEYLLAAEALGASSEGLQPRIWTGPAGRAAARELLSRLEQKHPEAKNIVFLPTGGANKAAAELASNIVAKRWPEKHYHQLAERLAGDGHNVLILGGPGELGLADYFRKAANGRIHVLIGQTSLRTTIGLIEAADAVVTNDSGPMHIAGALGTPLIAVFGPTDPRLFGPLPSNARVLRHAEPCSPCFDDTVFPNIVPECRHRKCMYAVSPDKVYAALTELLRETGKT